MAGDRCDAEAPHGVPGMLSAKANQTCMCMNLVPVPSKRDELLVILLCTELTRNGLFVLPGIGNCKGSVRVASLLDTEKVR